MILEAWLLWGFIATLLLTTMLSGATQLRLTRIGLPWLLGSMFTPDRDRARVIGFLVHLLNGWAFALLYILAFEWTGQAGWLRGALYGALHAAFVLVVGMSLLPGLHPRMASESSNASVVRGLEPPGFLALHYGGNTPVIIFLAHVVYGAVLGAFYEPA